MFLVRTLVVCSLAVSLFLTGTAADAAKPKAGKKKHPVHGVVTVMDDGAFSVKVQVGKKKAASAGTEATEKKFSFGEGTKFVKVTGKKKDRVETEATKEDLKVGSKILVVSDGEKAEKVMILPGKTAKKKKSV